MDDPCLPEEPSRPYELPVNCRNTGRIAAHCAALAGYENRVHDGTSQGDEPTVVRVRNMREAFRTAKQLVLRLCHPEQGGLARSQIAVLVPSVSGVELPTRFGAVPLTQELQEWNQGKGVLIASWKRFKGLEADAVVIIEKPARTSDSAAGQCEPLRGEIKG